MARHITTGIDIGTYQIKVVVAEQSNKNKSRAPVILGTGFAQSKGLRHGYIINTTDIARSIEQAIKEAEKASGIKIKQAHLAVGGVGLDELRSHGETLITRADNEVTDLDIEKALTASENAISRHLPNRKIIHVIPLRFKLDGEAVLGRPIGMKGSKLEVETLFITSLEQHLQDLISVIEDSGISVLDVMASPIAASFVTLTKTQKTAGCVLANIGSETVSLVVFEENIPLSVKVFPIGSTDITNDIALGLQVSLEEAEQIKRGAITHTSYSQKELDRIIVARLSDIFELIEAHLKKIGKNGLLPAGIILAGGGSGVTTIEDLARAALKIPSRRVSLTVSNGLGIKDSSWAVAYGLCIWGFSDEIESIGLTIVRGTSGTIIDWIKQFLP